MGAERFEKATLVSGADQSQRRASAFLLISSITLAALSRSEAFALDLQFFATSINNGYMLLYGAPAICILAVEYLRRRRLAYEMRHRFYEEFEHNDLTPIEKLLAAPKKDVFTHRLPEIARSKLGICSAIFAPMVGIVCAVIMICSFLSLHDENGLGFGWRYLWTGTIAREITPYWDLQDDMPRIWLPLQTYIYFGFLAVHAWTIVEVYLLYRADCQILDK